MKKYVSGILLLVVIMLTNSCETDFTTIADYKDITVVYGLLDSRQPDQYIKINKAYLSESDVLSYAANPDSNQYLYKLEVSVEEWSDAGNKIKTHILDTATIYNKEPGQFYYPEQVVYKWNKPDQPYDIKYIVEGLNDTVGVEYFWLNEESNYKLIIKNPETGKEITSETGLVKDFRITKPGFGQTIRFVPDPINPKEFEWEEAENGTKYEFELRFNYGEWNWGSQDTVYKYIVLTSSSVSGGAGSNTMSYYYWDDQFFSTCENLIPYSDPAREDEVRERYTSFIEVVVSVAEEDFAKYIEVNEPSTSIVQERPNFSNIENGLGIFSSRYRKTKTKKLHSETINDLKDLDTDLKFKF